MASEPTDPPVPYSAELHLHGQPCVVIGGGAVATRKVRDLVAAGANVTVVSPELTRDLQSLVANDTVRHISRCYRDGDCSGAMVTIAATNDRSCNQMVAADAQAAGSFVTVADDPSHSSLTRPAVLRQGPLTVSVSTDAHSPIAAAHVRDEVEAMLDPAWQIATEALGELRDELREAIPDPIERRRRVRAALHTGVLDALFADPSRAREVVRHAVLHTSPEGRVSLVGSGPGDPELLTIRGMRLLSRADVVVHDRLGTHDLLHRVPTDAEVIDVGKTPGHHGVSQDSITSLLIDRAQRGLHVVRLKGGDPFIFGRGGEEALAIAEAGITVDIVPGISSSIGAIGAAGIPATHRAVSQVVTIASGHDDPASHAAAARWEALGAVPGTLVLLMAMRNLSGICHALIDAGRAPDEPACAIEWATTPRERRVTATLGTLSATVDRAGIANPAVVVVGSVVEVGRHLFDALAQSRYSTGTPASARS